MADTNKKEYTSNLHPKGDLDTTVYPNVKSENIIDKDTTAYNAGKVPDSSLVSKSLDGLNEKIETNKIQTDTNKTNISTLQGDIALLETNAIKKDTDASLKSLTLPTASAFKTKDGTSFGGGSSIYNGTEFLPTFDIATLKDTYLPLTGGTLTGNLDMKKNNIYFALDNIRTGKIGIINTTYSETPTTSTGYREFYGIGLDESPKLMFKYNEAYISSSKLSYIGMNTSGTTISNAKYDGTIQLLSYDLSSGDLKHKFVMKSNALPAIDDSPIITQATLATDLATKQDKRFVHTVEIHYASNGSYFCFTGTSDKNTPIDSVEDLTTVFANRDLCGVGIFGSAGLSKIHVGSSVNDTIFKKYMNNGEYANPSEETFAMVFNTTGFTITDSVKPL